MAFDCSQYGSFCMFLGDYIVIVRQTGPFSFDCESVSTDSSFTAEIDEDKHRIFMDFTFPEQNPDACRFLRQDGNLLSCTIHRDNPAQCKFYRCIVMRISDARGMLVGTMRGTLDLHSDDPWLRIEWEEMMRRRQKNDGEAKPWAAAFLKEKGYHVD